MLAGAPVHDNAGETFLPSAVWSIGTTSFAFSVVYGTLIRDLPVRNANNLMAVQRFRPAVTPLRAGSQPLLDIAQFMAGLMKEPSVNRRFQLKSWEIKPAASAAQGAPELLDVNIVLAERRQ